MRVRPSTRVVPINVDLLYKDTKIISYEKCGETGVSMDVKCARVETEVSVDPTGWGRLKGSVIPQPRNRKRLPVGLSHPALNLV